MTDAEIHAAGELLREPNWKQIAMSIEADAWEACCKFKTRIAELEKEREMMALKLRTLAKARSHAT